MSHRLARNLTAVKPSIPFPAIEPNMDRSMTTQIDEKPVRRPRRRILKDGQRVSVLPSTHRVSPRTARASFCDVLAAVTSAPSPSEV